ncbi:MAG: response regulator, partial [Bacteroidota bacterium]
GFSRAKEALAFVKMKRPAVILCDWMMPEMDGISFTNKIKGHMDLADIPLVMVTCKTANSAKRIALAAGVTDFISKPVRMDVLANRVREIIDQPYAGQGR